MKKCLWIALGLLVLSSAASAQAPPLGYIALFTDSLSTSPWCVTTPPIGFKMYIVCLPGVNGQYCAEFALDYGSDPALIKSTITTHPNTSVAMGDLEVLYSICFSECYTDWHWILNQQLYLTAPNQNTIYIIDATYDPPSTPPGTYFAGCDAAMTMEPCIKLNNLYINHPTCPEWANDSASWGTIKNMYKK